MSEPTRSAAPFDLTTERLEAFSDAVIAVIITILALGLELPSSTSWLAIREQVGSFLIYILAFVNLAIWWNNHHHLLRATTRINGAVMWANMALLFFLSLIPVATQWLRTAHQPKPAAFFGLVSFCAGIAYSVLIRTIIRANGPDSVVAVVPARAAPPSREKRARSWWQSSVIRGFFKATKSEKHDGSGIFGQARRSFRMTSCCLATRS